MKKVPLSPLGVQQLLSQLYALPDPELQQEAQQAGNDFKYWVSSHVELAQHQVVYLDSLPEAFVSVAAEKVNFYLVTRKPISLKQPFIQDGLGKDEPIEQPGKYLQIFEESSTIYVPVEGGEGAVFTEESLVFSFVNPVNP